MRWVSASENMKNKSSQFQRQYNFIDELPETAEPLEHYNNHEFDDLWIDYASQKLYIEVMNKYRELLEHHIKHTTYYVAYDRYDGKKVKLFHSRLFD